MKRFKQFLHTTLDVFKIYWEIAPLITIGILITQIVLQLQQLVVTYILAIFIDSVIKIVSTTKNVQQLIPLIALYVGVSIIFDFIGNLNGYLSGILQNKDSALIRLKQTDLLIKLGVSKMENPELTNKSTRFTEIYNSMNQHLTSLVTLISILFSSIAYAIAVYSYTHIVVFAMFVFFIIKFISNGRFINKLWRLSLEHTEERRNAWTSMGYLADPTSLKEILLSGGVNLLRNKFLTFIEWNYKKIKEIRASWSVFENLQAVVDGGLFGWGIFLLMQKVLQSAMSIGTFTFNFRTLGLFSDQLNALSYRIANVMDSSIRLQDALEMFELYEPEVDGTKLLITNGKPPQINIDDISFSYPNSKKAVIENLSLSFNPGEKVAIVGENGAGKTTLVKLLTRIYRPQTGKICLKSIDINDIKKDSLYKKFGVLFQDFNTYGNLTVSENIQMGKVSRKVSKSLIEKALLKADAMGFVEKYPKKLEQVLSERYKGGIRPSGGQWQKLAIARFFYRNAPVLILDEPTASIDAISEAEIFNNIYKFMTGKTVIIISHRFSTVRNADRILVLDKGRIIEEGSHEELLSLDGKYARMYRLQAKGYA